MTERWYTYEIIMTNGNRYHTRDESDNTMKYFIELNECYDFIGTMENYIIRVKEISEIKLVKTDEKWW